MEAISQSFSVSFNYTVHFTQGVFAESNSLLRDLITKDGREGLRKALFVIDANVNRAHPRLTADIRSYCVRNKDLFQTSGKPLIVPGGEKSKNDRRIFAKLLKAISDFGICRHSYIIGIGGGAVLDVAGFAASCAHRGVRFIRIPTTVLSQNDAGIGVKNGVNHFGKKNFLGAFSPPFAVINDFNFLTSLGMREWRAGIAEAVKAGLIKDRDFFFDVCGHAAEILKRDMTAMRGIIHRCAEIHLSHIASQDPFEKGTSRPLDFGHWAAHKLEQMTRHRVLHGEAVASGIALDSTYSYLCGLLPEAEWEQIIKGIKSFGFKLYHAAFSDKRIFSGLDEFREHLGGPLTVMLLKGIGQGIEVNEMDKKIILKAASVLKKC